MYDAFKCITYSNTNVYRNTIIKWFDLTKKINDIVLELFKEVVEANNLHNDILVTGGIKSGKTGKYVMQVLHEDELFGTFSIIFNFSNLQYEIKEDKIKTETEEEIKQGIALSKSMFINGFQTDRIDVKIESGKVLLKLINDNEVKKMVLNDEQGTTLYNVYLEKDSKAIEDQLCNIFYSVKRGWF